MRYMSMVWVQSKILVLLQTDEGGRIGENERKSNWKNSE